MTGPSSERGAADVEALSALCKDAFYAARDAGETMHTAADNAAFAILASDWLATREAAARAEGAREVRERVEAVLPRNKFVDLGEAVDVIKRVRAALTPTDGGSDEPTTRPAPRIQTEPYRGKQ